MRKFLLIASSQHNLHDLGIILAKLRKTISYLEIFQMEEFQPPRRILITDYACGPVAELFKESFVDLFQSDIRIPNIPGSPISQSELAKKILSSDADIVFAISHHPLKEVLPEVNKDMIIPQRKLEVCFCDIHKGEIFSESVEEKTEQLSLGYQLTK